VVEISVALLELSMSPNPASFHRPSLFVPGERSFGGNHAASERVVQLDRFPPLPKGSGSVDKIGIWGEQRSERIHVVTIPCFRESIHHSSHGFYAAGSGMSDTDRSFFTTDALVRAANF
jgi:hypothetical protein